MMDRGEQKLTERVEWKARRLREAEKERKTILGYTIFLGTVGVVFILPVVLGAYFGLWMDEHHPHHTMSWTVCLICFGIATGAFNAFWLIREHMR